MSSIAYGLKDMAYVLLKSLTSLYGINRRSSLSRLEHFDITKQIPQDPMHLLQEGILPSHTGLFLHYVIMQQTLLTTEHLQAKIASFPFA